MTKIMTLSLSETANRELTATDDFAERVMAIHGIDRNVFDRYSWELETDDYRGAQIIGLYDTLSCGQPPYNFYTSRIFFDEMWESIIGDFSALVSYFNSSYLLVRTEQDTIYAESSNGYLNWTSDMYSPEVDGIFLKYQNDIIDILHKPSPWNVIELADWLYSMSYSWGFGIRGVEKDM